MTLRMPVSALASTKATLPQLIILPRQKMKCAQFVTKKKFLQAEEVHEVWYIFFFPARIRVIGGGKLHGCGFGGCVPDFTITVAAILVC